MAGWFDPPCFRRIVMLVRLLLLVAACVVGCQSKPAPVPPAQTKPSLADKMQAAKELSADAEAYYRRQVAKLDEYKEASTMAHGTGNEDLIARTSKLQSDQKDRVFDAKLVWEEAEQAVKRLAKQIAEE